MGAVRRHPLVTLALLGALLAGCSHHSSGGAGPPTSRTGGSAGPTSSTAPLPPSGLHDAFFSGEADGWALSEEPCPPPGGGAHCAIAWKTTDGGRAWSRLAAVGVPAGGADGGPDSVGEVRFADAQHGWVYNRSLFATFNGGRRWQPVDLGRPVVSLEAAGGSAYALVGDCDAGTGACRGPMRLAEGTIATGRWRYVSPGFDLPATDGGMLVVNRSAVYALITGGGVEQLFLARTTAGRWERRTPPCLRSIVEPIAGGDGLVAACRPATPGGPVELQTSSDGGRTWAVVWQYTFPQPVVSLAVTGAAAVVTLENGDVLRTTDNGMQFSSVLQTGAVPQVVFSDADRGTLTAGPAGGRQLFRTADGGATWNPIAPPR
jgi:hypothetical protein